MRTTYYPDGRKSHVFHVGDLVRLTKPKHNYGMHCTNMGKITSTIPTGTWGKIWCYDDCGRHRKSGDIEWGRVYVRLDGYSHPIGDFRYVEEFQKEDLEPCGIPAGFKPWPNIPEIRKAKRKAHLESIKYEGWPNAGTWMIVMYMEQDRRYLQKIFDLVRKDGTINRGRLRKALTYHPCPSLDGWVYDLPYDERAFHWEEIAVYFEQKAKELKSYEKV